jgi:hypothetical protein
VETAIEGEGAVAAGALVAQTDQMIGEIAASGAE